VDVARCTTSGSGTCAIDPSRRLKEETMRDERHQISTLIGRGLLSGLAGTALMTLAQTLEMKATGREPSTTPADAVEKLLELEPRTEEAEQRLNLLTHWAYGTGWGLVRGALGALGVRGPAAAAAHLALVWGTALVLLPALELAPPPREWGGRELAKDLGFHAVYALGASLAFEALDRRS
jgi:hypothetical protein